MFSTRERDKEGIDKKDKYFSIKIFYLILSYKDIFNDKDLQKLIEYIVLLLLCISFFKSYIYIFRYDV